jgi:hypothetical protein
MDDERRTPRLTAVSVAGFLLFAPPLLSLFDRADRIERVAGVPLLWAYLFLAWALVIGLIAAVVRD